MQVLDDTYQRVEEVSSSMSYPGLQTQASLMGLFRQVLCVGAVSSSCAACLVGGGQLYLILLDAQPLLIYGTRG